MIVSNLIRVLYVTVSSVTKGEQMIPVLNALEVNTAVYGNHDFGMCCVLIHTRT